MNQLSIPKGVFIHPNGDVEFRIYAPHAHKVEVSGITGSMSAKRIPLHKGENGYFTGCVSDIPSGFHYTDYFIDDVLCANAIAPLCYGCFAPTSYVDIPERDDDFYLCKSVSHGDVYLELYHSQVTDTEKCCYVYTPPGYDSCDTAAYPVLYLQHGVGENETGWLNQGHANFILDNLIAAGQCEPMIVVMNSGYALTPEDDPVFFPGDFTTELIADCIPYIESHFRVKQDKHSRAIAGLSLGSAQAFATAIRFPELFAYVGIFSGAISLPQLSQSETDLFHNPSDFNSVFLLLYASAGTGETRLITDTAPWCSSLQQRGFSVYFETFPGFHEWSPWRKSLREFSKRLFKGGYHESGL